MEAYGKIFRAYSNNKLEIKLIEYFPDIEKYHEVVLKSKNQGLKQVIMNSEIMMNILNSVLLKSGYILSINFSDNTDEHLINNVKSLLRRIKENPIHFIDLKNELEWALDKNSIDISDIEIYYSSVKCSIFSNGIVHGSNVEFIFNEILKKVLDEYLK